MLTTWMPIIFISLIQVTHAFSFPSSSSSSLSRLFRPLPPTPRKALRRSVNSSAAALAASSSSSRHDESPSSFRRSSPLSISQLGSFFLVRNTSIHHPIKRQRRRRGRGQISLSSSSSSSASPTSEELTTLKQENQLLQERLELLQIQNDQLLLEKATVPYEQRLILEDFEGEGILTLDDDVCEFDDQSNTWMSGGGLGECPIEPNLTFLDAMKSRANWLVGLLALQSCSGFILSRNEMLLQDHPVIVYFLTMLVGAGGNAGNQASVRVIRGIALGTLNPQTQTQFLSRELRMAFVLSLILSLAGFLRAMLFQTPLPETLAVTMALSMIVFSSICLGAVLPLVLQKVGVDPAHSSTTIQVVMDILGVLLTVFVSTLVLDSGWGDMLIKAMGVT